MSEVRVGWVTDTHIDYCQYGLERRRNDFAEAYKSAVKDMIRNKMNFCIHTGDMLHSNRPSTGAVATLLQVQELLAAAEMDMLINQGNHDYAKPSWISVIRDVRDPHGMVDIDYTKVERCGLRIYGAPSMSREEFLKHEFPDCDILMLHQAVVEFIGGYPSPTALTIKELPTKGKQIVAMGDIHVHRIIDDPSITDAVVGYAGSTELNSDSEQDDKYWVELVFQDGKLKEWHKHRIATRPVIRLKLTKEEDIATAIWDIHCRIEAEKLREEMRGPIIIVNYLFSIPGVMERLKQGFDPDDVIFRWKPQYESPMHKSAEGVMEEVSDQLKPQDILRSMEPPDSRIFRLVSQGINPDTNFNAVADAYIEERMHQIDTDRKLDTI